MQEVVPILAVANNIYKAVSVAAVLVDEYVALFLSTAHSDDFRILADGSLSHTQADA